MDNEFSEVMSKRTDAELLEVINSSPGDYQPIALDAARIEFKKRHLSNEQIALVKDEIKQKQDLEDAQNNEPLSTGGKIFAFIFPGYLMTILLGFFTADRNQGKSKEMFKWELYGTCFYIGLALISLVIFYFSK